MSKRATKAAGNVFYLARIAAAAFNERLSSREGAAEELGIDRTRLARIELGSLNPYPEEVLLMADAYRAPQLRNQYCCTSCPLGAETVLPAEVLELDRITVKLISSLRKTDAIKESLLDITADGVITEEERPELEEIICTLDEYAQSAAEVKLWVEKHMLRR